MGLSVEDIVVTDTVPDPLQWERDTLLEHYRYLLEERNELFLRNGVSGFLLVKGHHLYSRICSDQVFLFCCS